MVDITRDVSAPTVDGPALVIWNSIFLDRVVLFLLQSESVEIADDLGALLDEGWRNRRAGFDGDAIGLAGRTGMI